MPGDDINFSVRAAVVGFQDMVATFFQEIPG